jgi:hypothetical protein
VGTCRTFGQGVLVGDGASNTTIEGNSFGRAPDGSRVGSTLGFGTIKFGNLAGVMVSPSAGSVTTTTIGGATQPAANTFSGNFLGIFVGPAGGGSSVAGVNIDGNLIGPKAPGKPSSFFGNVTGVEAAGNVTGLEIGGAGGLGNAIQGNIVGLLLGEGVDGAAVQNNDIGTDKNLKDMLKDLAAKEPSIGLHNFFGMILGDTQNVQVGGVGGLGNRILGNFIGVLLGGFNSQGNVVSGNSIGLSQAPTPSIDKLSLGQLGSITGLFDVASTQNVIGAPGAGNQFNGTLIGQLSILTTQETVQANTFDKHVIGQLAARPAGMTIGGTSVAAANTYVNDGVGLMMVNRELTKDEQQTLRTARATAKQRKKPYTAENSDLALDTAAPLVGDTDLSADAETIEPAAPGTNNTIQGNYIGTNASNAKLGNQIGAWFLGDLTSTTFGTGAASMTDGANTVAHNKTAGIWVGPPIAGSSKIDLRGNSIYDNYDPTNPAHIKGVQGLGIDLLPPNAINSDDFELYFGVTPNDPGDADTGGNGAQNYPEITSATATGNDLTLAGTLSSAASTSYSLELYASASCGRAGTSDHGVVTRYGEGETLIKRYDVVSGVGGTIPIDTTATLPPGKHKVTATATGPDGTSEFSACVAVL